MGRRRRREESDRECQEYETHPYDENRQLEICDLHSRCVVMGCKLMKTKKRFLDDTPRINGCVVALTVGTVSW